MAKGTVHVRIGARGIPVGTLTVEALGTRETSVFTYDPTWVARANAFAIAPLMPLGAAPFFTSQAVNGSSLPSPIADGTPDSWGRAIIKVALGGRVATDLDYLVESDDFLRSGALRYFDGPGPDARALAPPRNGDAEASVPRLLDLEQVIAEARAFEADPVHYRESRAKLLGGQLLKGAVGSLGGARPKVNARDGDGALWIVKLAKMDDQYAVGRAEVMALHLAARVGITPCHAEVLTNAQRFPAAMVKRFDRDAQGGRIPFISAQTFMGLPGTEPGNYVDVAFQMHAWSADPKADKRELFRRLLFNVLVQNTDDHLRNLGFLSRGNDKWGLSPAFDVNPVPDQGMTLKTAISPDHGNALDVDAVVEVAEYFDYETDEAAALATTMATTIRDEWRLLGQRLGMTASDVRAIAPAMENPQVDRAIAMATATVPGSTLP
ncbi:type II toxin-antitoxin system HipA family toxin [Methylobacterium aquaticum]|uniref:type II toxin-antitoxin system HipA family toxin n=1 Tax=Methylobacterium aquaticum TaxID=270351 RepID=UPI0019316483|nr:type II toxin-antitoxin system HipA family toxin [Methylobacterium aquaticum]QRE74986.1 type II toxin-antitoxin system HipA family toxin [Methylobacterium aquaticum]